MEQHQVLKCSVILMLVQLTQIVSQIRVTKACVHLVIVQMQPLRDKVNSVMQLLVLLMLTVSQGLAMEVNVLHVITMMLICNVMDKLVQLMMIVFLRPVSPEFVKCVIMLSKAKCVIKMHVLLIQIV